MKKTMRQWWAAVVAALGWMGAALGADIQYVADNGGGEYCGVGYGISVSVSAPASGYAVKYAESSTGPWQNTPVTYTDVCSAKPIYFQISADGYATVVDSRTVTITPKALTEEYVWLVLPTEDYVYDGTAKTPDVACGDGNPSIITTDDFDVAFDANVNAGTATATFTGKRNYTGTATEDFEILKADNGWITEPSMPGWTYGQAASEPSSVASNGTTVVTYGTAASPGALGTTRPTLPGSYVATFSVAESQNYKALSKDVAFAISPAAIQYVADNVSGEYNGSGYGIDATVSVSAPVSGATVRYSVSETGPWQNAPILYTNACEATPIYFEISATGYTTITNSRTVTITPKTLTDDYVWLILPTDDYVYDGTAKTPDVACGDGNPSIITTDDFDVSFSANVNAGTATATFTGKRNYAGAVTEDFEILRRQIALTSASNAKTYDGVPLTSDLVTCGGAGFAPGEGFDFDVTGSQTDAGESGNEFSYTAKAGTLVGNYDVTKTVGRLKVSPRTIVLTSGDATKVYDGTPVLCDTINVSGDGFAAGEGASYNVTGSQTDVGSSENTFTYRLANGAKAANYAVEKVLGQLVVTVLDVSDGGDGDWDIQLGDALTYDGTEQTQTLRSVSFRGIPFECEVSGDKGTDAGAYSMTLTGVGNFSGSRAVAWSIARRPISLSSPVKSKTYDGEPLSFTAGEVAVGGSGYATGESFSLSGFAEIVDVGSVPALYSVEDGTARLSNYELTRTDGSLTVTRSTVEIAVTAASGSWKYDGKTHSKKTYSVANESALAPGDALSVAFAASSKVRNVSDGRVANRIESVKVLRDGGEDVSANYTLAKYDGKLEVKPRSVVLTSGTATRAYDGTPLRCETVAVSGDGFASGEGADFSGFASQTDVGSCGNEFAYSLRSGTLAANYKIEKASGTLSVTPADISGGGEPGGGSVPAGGLSKFDSSAEYDGAGHTIDTNALAAAFGSAMVGEIAVEYATGGSQFTATVSDAMNCVPPCFTNVGEYVVWYRVRSLNYVDFVHQAKVAILPRDIAKAVIAPIPDVEFADEAAEPVPAVSDGEPSIITPADYSVEYLNNASPGTASVVLRGKGNYTGTSSATFTILAGDVKCALMTGTLAWKLNLGTGCYTAQLRLVCTNGLSAGISELRFIYEDRKSGSETRAGLWNSASRSYRPTATYSGTVYRYVDLDAGRIAAEGEEATFGVSDVSQPRGVVPPAECEIELYAKSLSSPLSDVGYVVWRSGRALCTLPISAAGGPQGVEVGVAGRVARLVAASAPHAPLSLSALNESLALGVVLDPASSPYCELSEFSVTPSGVSGRIDVGKRSADGSHAKGSLGSNARAVLLGTRSLGELFEEIGSVPVDASGSFEFYLGDGGFSFFRVRIDVEDSFGM